MAKVSLSNARSNKPEPADAAEDLLNQLPKETPKLVVVFADSKYDQRKLNEALRARLPKGTRLLGATSVMPIDNDGYQPTNCVAASLSGDFDVGIGLATKLTADAAAAGAKALTKAAEELGIRAHDLDARRHVGLVIDDGFKLKKEEFLVGMLDVNPAVTLIGGGACHQSFPDGSPEIHVDGEVATDSVAVAAFRVEGPWAALRHHAYVPTGTRLTITKVDDTAKRALEIDGKPAAQRYAELADVPVDKLESEGTMFRLSTAIKVGREYFMRAPWRPLPDGSIMFANMLTDNMELELMRLGDMPVMLEKFFREEVPVRVQNPQGMLLFECGTRGHLAGMIGQAEALGHVFAKAPKSAGMAVTFELCNGFQINSTMTSLAFGSTNAS